MTRPSQGSQPGLISSPANRTGNCTALRGRYIVITSYSIHYTKLYEVIGDAQTEFIDDARADTCGGRQAAADFRYDAGNDRVITSYSIHYTKLYDPHRSRIIWEMGKRFW